MHRSMLTAVAQTTVVGVLVAGAAVFVGMQKTVVLSVDGEQRTIHTYARTVQDVLEHEDLSVAEHDVVVPSTGSGVLDGSYVALRRGRQLVLNIDGTSRTLWTTATSVQEALGQLGLHGGDSYVSVSRSGRIPLDGADVTVRTPHRVTVLVDGERVPLTSTAASVGELLDEAGVEVRERDRVSPAVDAYPLDGDTVTVARVDDKQVRKQVAVPYKTVRKADSSMYKGDTTVRREGEPGLLVKTFRVTYVDGKQTDRKLVRTKRREKPVNKVVAYGTRAIPTGGGTVQIPSTGGLNWAALARCESGGRPDAVGGGGRYFGLYQFDLQTWRGQGGTGNPAEASPAEQTRRAQSLYSQRGRQPWPVCGRLL